MAAASQADRRHTQRAIYYMTLAFLGWFASFAIGISVPSEPFRDLVTESCFRLFMPPEPPAPAGAAKASGSEAVLAANPLPAANAGNPPPAKPRPRPLIGWQWLLTPLLVILIILTFTPTNLILLCSFGAMLGAYTVELIPVANRRRRALDDRKSHPHAEELHATDPPGAEDPFVGAAPGDERDDDVTERIPAVTATLHGLCVYLAIVAGLIVVQGQITFDSQTPGLYMRISAIATLLSIAAGTNRHFVRDISRAFSPWSHARDVNNSPKTAAAGIP